MVADSKFYDALGVKPDATPSEIKSAFRKLALVHHPDKNGGKEDEVFIGIRVAYETLRDPERRQHYDAFGAAAAAAPSGGGGAHNPFEDMLRGMFFGGGGGNGGPQQHHQEGARPQQSTTPDMNVTVDVDLRTWYREETIRISVPRKLVCTLCKGWGGASEPTVCTDCKGAGKVEQRIQLGPFTTVNVTSCQTCGGRGKRVRDTCTGCNGQCCVSGMFVREIKLERSFADRHTLRFEGESNQAAPVAGHMLVPGNICVTLCCKKGKDLVRRGDDLVGHMTIPLVISLCGGEITYEDAEGNEASVYLDPKLHRLLRPADWPVKFLGKGFAAAPAGHLILQLTVQLPKDLSDNDRAALAKILGNS